MMIQSALLLVFLFTDCFSIKEFTDSDIGKQISRDCIAVITREKDLKEGAFVAHKGSRQNSKEYFCGNNS